MGKKYAGEGMARFLFRRFRDSVNGKNSVSPRSLSTFVSPLARSYYGFRPQLRLTSKVTASMKRQVTDSAIASLIRDGTFRRLDE